MFELVQEMMFVNTCVKFCDNWLRNEVCRAVTPFEHIRTYIRADPYIPCEGIKKREPNNQISYKTLPMSLCFASITTKMRKSTLQTVLNIPHSSP